MENDVFYCLMFFSCKYVIGCFLILMSFGCFFFFFALRKSETWKEECCVELSKVGRRINHPSSSIFNFFFFFSFLIFFFFNYY